MAMRAQSFALGLLAGCFSLAGDAHGTSCFKVKAETAHLELEELRVNGVVAPSPAGYVGADVYVYRNFDGKLRLQAKRLPEWLWDEQFEP